MNLYIHVAMRPVWDPTCTFGYRYSCLAKTRSLGLLKEIENFDDFFYESLQRRVTRPVNKLKWNLAKWQDTASSCTTGYRFYQPSKTRSFWISKTNEEIRMNSNETLHCDRGWPFVVYQRIVFQKRILRWYDFYKNQESGRILTTYSCENILGQ